MGVMAEQAVMTTRRGIVFSGSLSWFFNMIYWLLSRPEAMLVSSLFSKHGTEASSMYPVFDQQGMSVVKFTILAVLS